MVSRGGARSAYYRAFVHSFSTRPLSLWGWMGHANVRVNAAWKIGGEDVLSVRKGEDVLRFIRQVRSAKFLMTLTHLYLTLVSMISRPSPNTPRHRAHRLPLHDIVRIRPPTPLPAPPCGPPPHHANTPISPGSAFLHGDVCIADSHDGSAPDVLRSSPCWRWNLVLFLLRWPRSNGPAEHRAQFGKGSGRW